MAEVFNPVTVEQAIADGKTRIAKGVAVCDERLGAFQAAEEAFEQAFAHAFLGYDGPQTEKKYAAVVATAQEKHAMNVAERAYKYARHQARALELGLSADQSIGRSVTEAYRVAGRGE